MTKTTYGVALRAIRERQGLTVSDLAERTGLSRQTLGNLESDRNEPRWSIACRIADALGVGMDKFRTGAGK